MGLIVAVIWFAIYAIVLGIAYAIFIWVAGLLGFPIPQNIVRLVGALLFLLLLLWFLVTLLGGGPPPYPKLGKIGVILPYFAAGTYPT